MWNNLDYSMDSVRKEYDENNYVNTSGISCDEVKKKCAEIFSNNISFAKAKSEVMAYILENCPVEVCPDDIFADKLENYGIINQKLMREHIPRIRKEVIDNTIDSRILVEAGAIEPTTDF